jgi:hypothetical protein
MRVHHSSKHGETLSLVTLICSGCDSEFERPDWDLVDAENYYCSYECRRNEGKLDCPYDGCEYTSDSELGIQQHHKRTHGISLTTVEYECDNCGESFQRQQSKVATTPQNFCSQDCKYDKLSTDFSERRKGQDNPMYGQTGEDHHRWNGGTTINYGTGWVTARRRALERDEYQCQDCSMSRSEHYNKYGYDLEVHHIKPFRTFNDSEEANRLTNLITVCTRCHKNREK